VGKRKHGEPDRFQRGGFEIDERPVDEAVAVASVKRFVETFIVAAKRERIQTHLLHHKRERRTETIQGLYKWIDPKMKTELAGNTGFPQHLHERFGDLRGVLLDEYRACHVTIAGAAVLSAAQFGAIFIADGRALALLFAEVGAPILCLGP
jgi:hypothetical protein